MKARRVSEPSPLHARPCWQSSDNARATKEEGGLAAAEIDALIKRLPCLLRRRFGRVPQDILITASEDAILDYVRAPKRFDPSRGVPLLLFLRASALRNVHNILTSENKRVLRERMYAERHPHCVDSVETVAIAHERIAALAAFMAETARTPLERKTLVLWLGGESSTDVLAASLGLEHAAPDVRRREIKRLKDRAIKALQRAPERIRLQLSQNRAGVNS